MNDQQNNKTFLSAEMTAGLGEIVIHHPPGTFVVTPASRIAIQAVCQYQHLLFGKGIDWGCGTGCLAIVAARIDTVQQVIGLDISEANLDVARQNALDNGVDSKVTFIRADSYVPYAELDRHQLATFEGRTCFVLANPPASEGDDGFEYRRLVLQGAPNYLVKGGVVFLSISSQYGQRRVDQLTQQITGFVHGGVLSSTHRVPFDLQRADLFQCLERYAQEERRDGWKYSFRSPEMANLDSVMDAQAALSYFQRTGKSPQMKWQTHLFRYIGNDIS